MKKAELESKRMLLASPIAGDDVSATSIDYYNASAQVDIANGFKSTYTTAPTKNDFNGVLKSATANQSYGCCGGDVTFSADICSAIGGYPKGAILKYKYGLCSLFVRSLVDNNMHNFITDGVDNINWEYCSEGLDNSQLFRPDIDWNAKKLVSLYTIYNNFTLGSAVFASGIFPSKGYVLVDWSSAEFWNQNDPNTSSLTELRGFRIVMSVGAIGQTSVPTSPSEIIANPINNSFPAFPIPLMEGIVLGGTYKDGSVAVTKAKTFLISTNQVQVQKGTPYSLFAYRNTGGLLKLLDSGSINIYFLPTPD